MHTPDEKVPTAKGTRASSPGLLGAAALLSACLTPTEIRVVVVSHDLDCASGDLVFADLDILARPHTGDLAEGPADGTSSRCVASSGRSDLGSIVLTPRDASGRAELLVVAGVKIPSATPAIASSAEECLVQYRAFLSAGAPKDYCKDPAHACGACIVARRGLGFVTHAKLELEVDLGAQCAGVFCEAGQTCGQHGECVSAEATCQKGQCNLGSGGAGGGGTGGSGGVGGSGGSGGTGGGGGAGGCVVPGDQGAISFTNIGLGVAGARDIAADGLGSAWVALPNAVFECSTTACGLAYTPPASVFALRQIAADGATVAASRANGVVRRTGNVWSTTPAPPACAFGVAGITSVAATKTSVFIAGTNTTAGTTTAFAALPDDPLCTSALRFDPGGTAPHVFALDSGSLWLTTDQILGHPTTPPDGVGIGFGGGVALDLWGFDSAPATTTMFACNATGLHRVRFTPQLAQGDDLLGTSCVSIAGIDRCDGSADVWFVTQSGSLYGVHAGTGPLLIPFVFPAPATSVPVAVTVDRDSIWLATDVGVFRSPRMLLP